MGCAPTRHSSGHSSADDQLQFEAAVRRARSDLGADAKPPLGGQLAALAKTLVDYVDSGTSGRATPVEVDRAAIQKAHEHLATATATATARAPATTAAEHAELAAARALLRQLGYRPSYDGDESFRSFVKDGAAPGLAMPPLALPSAAPPATAGVGASEGDASSDSEEAVLLGEDSRGEAKALIWQGVTYRVNECVHLLGEDSECMVARIDRIRRWREGDALEPLPGGAGKSDAGSTSFEAGEVVILCTWFYRPKDTSNPKVSNDPREIFCTAETDYNQPAAICCGAKVHYIPYDDEAGLIGVKAEMKRSDDALLEHARDDEAGAAPCELERCTGCHGDGINPCKLRHYYFRQWYDPQQRQFSKSSPQQGKDEEAALVRRENDTRQRIYRVNLGVDVKLRVLLDHVAALKVNKAYRHMAIDRRLPMTIKRSDLVGCVLRAFATCKGPSLFRQTEVKFVRESGIDRGGLTSEMLNDFFDNLVPAKTVGPPAGDAPPGSPPSVGGADATAASSGGVGVETFGGGGSGGGAGDAQCAVPLFETSHSQEDATYWLPREGLHKLREGNQMLDQLHSVGKVLAKCLLELHACPPSFPPVLFATLAYGGDEDTLARDLIPSGEACTCVRACSMEDVMAAGGGGGGGEHTTCAVHRALELLAPFDPKTCQSLRVMLEEDIPADSTLTVGDVLGHAPYLRPTPEAVAEMLLRIDNPDEGSDGSHSEEGVDGEDGADGDKSKSGDGDKSSDGRRSRTGAGRARGSGGGGAGEMPPGASSRSEEVARAHCKQCATEASVSAAVAAPNDADQLLTNANKAAAITRVVSYTLLECRLPEIIALRRGFHTIKWMSHTALFTGDELRELMCGSAHLDAADLFTQIRFDERGHKLGLYSAMEALLQMRDESWRKRLLRFVTGAFMLPRGGLLRSISVRTGAEREIGQLPRASTCTYTLFLPPYRTLEELDSKLTTAIDNTAGFWVQ